MEKKSFFSRDSFIFVVALVAVISGWLGWMYIPLILKVAEIMAEIFINLLKLISLPLIFLSIVSTITSMKSFEEMKQLGKKVLKYTLSTTIAAAALALVIFRLINPVRTIVSLPQEAMAEGPTQGYLSFLMKIVPPNIVEAFSNNANVMSIVFIAILLSFSILSLPHDNKKILEDFFSSLFAAILKITHLILYVMPAGVWAFITLFTTNVLDYYYTGKNDFLGFQNLLLYTVCILLANLLQGIVVLPLLLKFKNISPLKTARGMYSALVVAFFSKSSNATLPVTIQCAEQQLGISSRVARFTLPLCSIINMNGCAAFMLITVLFVSMSYGITFSLLDMIAWIFIATIAAVGNAGVPMGCYFLTSAFLVGMNVPLQIMGVILPLYTVIDMIETTLNVWSDSCIAAIVDKEVPG